MSSRHSRGERNLRPGPHGMFTHSACTDNLPWVFRPLLGNQVYHGVSVPSATWQWTFVRIVDLRWTALPVPCWIAQPTLLSPYLRGQLARGVMAQCFDTHINTSPQHMPVPIQRCKAGGPLVLATRVGTHTPYAQTPLFPLPLAHARATTVRQGRRTTCPCHPCGYPATTEQWHDS